MSTKTTSTSIAEIAPQNAGRKSFTFQNEDVTDSIFIKKERPGSNTVSSIDHDYKLFPGASISLNFQSDGQEAIQERWTCVASANTPRLSFVETEDFKR